MAIKDTLAERGKVHGDFTDNAEISQAFKDIVHSHDGKLTPVMREGIDMILGKVGRILSGNPAHKDHWHDIAGYATLVEERI